MPEKPARIIVLGGSAGGIEAFSNVLRPIPANLPAAIFLVLHINPSVPSLLPSVLKRRTQLRVQHARDGAEIEAGTVYIAPPDRHLLLHGGVMRLGRGARENGFRPAVDPLFRTAAVSYGPAVIGVIVSGNLDDGTSGLIEIKRHGGIGIVQAVDDAIYAGMPASALQEVPDVDYVVPASAIGPTIVGLVNDQRVGSIILAVETEPDIAMGGEAPVAFEERIDEAPAGIGCPDCGGTLWERKEGELVRYRCRVGHAYSDEALLAAQTEALEEALWTALRALEETSEQAGRIADRMERRGHDHLATRFTRQARDAARRATIVRSAITLNQGNNEAIQEVS